MSVTDLPLSVWRLLSVALLGVGGGAACALGLDAYRAELAAALARYESRLAEDLLFLRIDVPARRLIWAQGVVMALALVAALLWSAFLGSLFLTCALSVRPALQNRRLRRTTAIEEQMDGWLQNLASGLRATPALGEAIANSVPLAPVPLREELEMLVKEQCLGTPLDEALARMGLRTRSRTVRSALGTLRIGRSTGGDLSSILERSAATLREMARLEGVLRTKTAEGKAQAFVLAVVPFLMVGLLTYINPDFLAPLLEGPRGYAVIAGALVLWATAILSARRILHVDL